MDEPAFPLGEKRMTCPVIIMRHGGLDGVALQKKEYHLLLNHLGIHLHVITGCEETQFGPIESSGQLRTVIKRLDFFHPDSLILYGNSFEYGSETGGVKPLLRDEWLELFQIHKNKIREKIEGRLVTVPDNTPVIVYNFLSLRHYHPAAACAIKELIQKYPQRAFISHSADPDAERPEKINRIKKFVLEKISSNPHHLPYSGGPYKFQNLYHIVLNPTQKKAFLSHYTVPEDRIFEIPDFLEFHSRDPQIRKEPKLGFIEYLSANHVFFSGHTYSLKQKDLLKDTIFFLSPVRPVYRKRLKEAMLLSRLYGLSRNENCAFIVTHPNTDDRDYFLDTVKFAGQIGLPYIYLGDHFSLKHLNDVYENMASMPTIGVIASRSGGWENALNEMANACIPFFMSSALNSFKPLTKQIKIRTFGMKFKALKVDTTGKRVNKNLVDTFKNQPMVDALFKWVDDMLDQPVRRSLIEHNYRQAYKYLSSDATSLKLWHVIWKIYATQTIG